MNQGQKINHWTLAEVNILKARYEEVGVRGCIPLLPGRTQRGIRHKAIKIGLLAPDAQDIKRRLEKKIKKTDSCWVWTGAKHPYGYGVIRENGTQSVAHRVSYRAYKGDIPFGMFVCHSCDNPQCINPDHLFLGTPKDNSQDMVKKGRSARGEASPHHKLTEEQVRAIRADDRLAKDIAKDYGVAFSTISKIKLSMRWGHV